MSGRDLYRFLVPDAPIRRRTEADPHREGRAARAFARAAVPTPAPTPALDSPRLVSSFSGTIERLLMAIPSYGVDSPALVRGYRSVVSELRPGTAFVVVVHEARRAEVESWFVEAGHAPEATTVVPLPDYVSFTDWAEDGYVAVVDSADGSHFLVEPWTFPRAGDALIADAVEQATSITAAQAPLIFQGGNCLVGPDFWLLGRDYFVDSVDLVEGARPPVVAPEGEPLDDFVRRLFTDYVDADRELRLVGTRKPIPIRPYYGRREGAQWFLDIADGGAGTFQPIFHLDMFVTLVGTVDGAFTALVGDPSMALDLVGGQAPYALQDVYDQIAADLADAGLRVLRNPLVHQPSPGRTLALAKLDAAAADEPELRLAVQELTAAGAVGETPVRVRDWHHITWNNCLVENTTDAGGPHVYLPTFGHGDAAHLAAIDDHMAELWAGLGFTVHRLADFTEFARRQGVVHCITKYLARSEG